MKGLDKKEYKINFAGQELTLSVSRLAEQATAAVLGQYGETTVLATVTMGKENKDSDYFPLVVDYEEKFYAAGKIIGSRFVRREGRPSEEAILSGRLIDRSLRPLFNQRIRRDVQVVITVLSYDEENDPDFIALIAASTAISISEIPWMGPVAGVRLTRTSDKEIIINPKNSQIKESGNICFESFIAGTKSRVNMIELAGYETTEEDVADTFEFGQKPLKELIEFQESIIKEIGKEKAGLKLAEDDESLQKEISEFVKGKLEAAIYVKDKTERENNLAKIKNDLIDYLKEKDVENLKGVEILYDEEITKVIRKNILDSEKRPDLRKIDEVRELYAEVGLFKRLHGSAIFSRGNTQALAVTTLAAPGAEQMIESMEISEKRRFMLHYNFPPYSVGETGRVGAPGRREIGHGALAEKALKSMIPSKDEFPYTIRLVSEILSSNGSSSMATVCAGTLALMDAGVPLKKPVAGIAMGLITEEKDGEIKNYKVLTDLQGPEDHHGDMDFKVAGTKDGITAIQLDVKIEGLTQEIIKKTLIQAKEARLQILDVLTKTITKPREKVSDFAPVIMTIDINPDQIGEVIGPGGKIINGIIAATGATSIDIEQTGKVFIAAPDKARAQAAYDQVKAITKEFQIGEIVEGEIVRMLEFGAIVDLGGGRDGMIHVSELKDGFVKKVEDVVKLGDRVRVKVIKSENGKLGLSLKAMKTEN